MVTWECRMTRFPKKINAKSGCVVYYSLRVQKVTTIISVQNNTSKIYLGQLKLPNILIPAVPVKVIKFRFLGQNMFRCVVCPEAIVTSFFQLFMTYNTGIVGPRYFF
jgi:hypothetical protein